MTNTHRVFTSVGSSAGMETYYRTGTIYIKVVLHSNIMLLNLLLLLQLVLLANGSFTQEFTHENVTSNIEEWDKDLVIMFYAPWCKYCKQFSSSYEQIASLMITDSNVAVGKYNCEVPSSNNELCVKLGVDRYPSLYYLGYGNYHQAPPKGFIFGTNDEPRLVRYNADIYPEAIYDWILMLSKISWIQRKYDDVKTFFSGSKKNRKTRRTHSVNSNSDLKKLEKEKALLEEKVKLFSAQLEKYKADELFDSLEDNGDPFVLLAPLTPNEENLPFRVCVGEMANEYCRYHEEEKYCKNLMESCLESNLEPKICRPNACPFNNYKGCKVVSTCMQQDVLDQYIEALK